MRPTPCGAVLSPRQPIAAQLDDLVVSAITCRLRVVPDSRFFSILPTFGVVPEKPAKLGKT
jgi:hypothetical protein